MVGHYGRRAVIATAVAVALLIIHLAVPFGLNDHDAVTNDLGQGDEAVSRADIVERYDIASDVGGASPGITLGGIILALVAAALLLVTGLIPMPVAIARFVGWLLGSLGALGAFMATLSSAYWVGTGFTTLLSLIPGNVEPVTRLWIISPVLVMAGAIYSIILFLQVITDVVATRDGLRDQARGLAKGAVFATVFAAVVLVMPWSFQILEGAERRDAGLCPGTETCDPSYTFFTAYGHGAEDTTSIQYAGEDFGGILAIAETTKDDDPGLFQGLAFSIKVMVASAWVGFIVPLAMLFASVFSSAFKFPAAARWAPVATLLSAIMIAWSAVMFILASAYMWKPSWDSDAFFGTLVEDQLWMPGFLSFITGAIIVFWGLHHARVLKDVFAGMGGKAAIEKSTVSFD